MAGMAPRKGMITGINVTPLVDIMLVLLIIFMLTAHVIARQAIEIELPQASQGTAPVPTTLNIALKRDGSLQLNGQPVAVDALGTAIQAAVVANPKVQALIAADKDVPYGRIVGVLDLVQRLKVTSFALQIDPTGLIPPGMPAAPATAGGGN